MNDFLITKGLFDLWGKFKDHKNNKLNNLQKNCDIETEVTKKNDKKNSDTYCIIYLE